MTRRELNLAIFEGTANAVLWQPRLETWISHHQENGTLPERFKNKTNLEIYDELGCSIRYAASAGLEGYTDEDIKHIEKQQGKYYISTIITPAGELKTVHQDVYGGIKKLNRRIVDFPVKTVEDLKVLTYTIEHQQFRANLEDFKKAEEKVGHRAEPTGWLSSSGFTDLIKWHCGLENTYYLLNDNPSAIEEHLEICNNRDDRMIDEALKLPFRIFNLGDHAIDEFTPPSILKKYLLPRWQRISNRLHKHNRYVHSHWDGNAKTILKFLKDTGLDGVEALPPVPMGNVTLEEIKSAVENKMVVLDLLPAIHFLSHYTLEETLEFAKRVIDIFAPRLILGVSDEISEVGQIEKIEAISKFVDDICGLAE